MADARPTNDPGGLSALSGELMLVLEQCAPRIWDLIQAEKTFDIAMVFCDAYRTRERGGPLRNGNDLVIELSDRARAVTVAAIACPSTSPAGPGDDLDQLVAITLRLTGSDDHCLAIIVHGILADWAPSELERTLHNQLFVQLSTYSTPKRKAVAEALAVTSAYKQPAQSRCSAFSKESHFGLVICRLPGRTLQSSTQRPTFDANR